MLSIVVRWRHHIRIEAPGAHQQVFRIRHGQVATAHWKWEAEEGRRLLNTDTRIFLMVRDPRDIVVSNAFYISEKNPRHRLRSYFADLESDEEWILASIIGVSRKELGGRPRSKSMGEHTKEFMP